jgi:hypothetical protein
MPLGAVLLLVMLAALVVSPAAAADETLTAAHTLLSAWHEDPARIDRARALLETAAATDATGDTLTELSHVWFLTGDFRARGEAERVTAYERGTEAAKRAIALAPRNDRAHLWLPSTVGCRPEIKGVDGRSPGQHDPRGVGDRAEDQSDRRGRGSGRRPGCQMPVLMGGDRGKAETLLKRTEIDPRLTGGRLRLAQPARHEALARLPARLQSIVDETAATDLPADGERPAARQGPLTELATAAG